MMMVISRDTPVTSATVATAAIVGIVGTLSMAYVLKSKKQQNRSRNTENKYTARAGGSGEQQQQDQRARDDANDEYDVSALAMHLRQLPSQELHFVFRGYSIWLELEQVDDGDLDRALDMASHDLHVHRIPGPHVTVIYGMTHLTPSKDDIKNDESNVDRPYIERFHQLQSIIQEWPFFHVKGIHTDTTYDGVDGEDMDMAWIEMTLGTSSVHEQLRKQVHDVFYRNCYTNNNNSNGDDNNPVPVLERWKPHLSLVYENPNMVKLNLHYSLSIMKRIPSLTRISHRRPIAIGLWKTHGQMHTWKCLARYELDAPLSTSDTS